MRYLILLFLVLFSAGLMAQQVVATAGSTHVNSNGSMSFTIGEGIAQTLSKGDKTLTQGFHQTTMSVSIVSELKDSGFSIAAFPNPATDYLIIKIRGPKDVQTQYLASLFNIHSVLLLSKKIEGNEITISMGDLTSAIYILKITADNKELKTFKIIKE